MKEDDSDATRTLFVGNMPADIRESEIRRVFEKYGKVEDVDIKTPPETNAAYAFVLFQVDFCEKFRLFSLYCLYERILQMLLVTVERSTLSVDT